jgi:NitT/TauT family transport system substrate-binding protein
MLMPRRVVMLIIAMLFLGCGPQTGSQPSGGPAPAGGSPVASGSPGAQAPLTPAKVNLGLLGSASDSGLYIAIDKGYFQEQAIEIEQTRFTSAAEMVAPLGTGQLDVGAGAPSAGLMNAIARDIPLRIVADKGNVNKGWGFQAIMVRKDLWDSGVVRGPADLKGRTISLNARDITPEIFFDTYLRTAGLTIADVNVVTLSFPDMAAGFANRAIDAALPIEPFVTQIVDAGTAVVAARADEVVPGQEVAVILYGPKFIEEKPDVARRFMTAYVKALREYNDAFAKKDAAKRAEVVEILVKNTPVKDTALYDRMIMPGLDPNGKVGVESLEQSQTWWLGKGSQTTRADLTRIVDNQFVDWAIQQLGPYRP